MKRQVLSWQTIHEAQAGHSLVGYAVLALIGAISFGSIAQAAITTTLIDHADNTSISGGAYYTPVAISVDIDPSSVQWIAWHDKMTPAVVNGVDYVGTYSWIAVDDYFNLTITNPLGTAQTVRMDYNDAVAVSSGPQAVIFGAAATAPNVARWGANWSPASAGRASSPKIFDEPGAFNSLFSTAGTYQFQFAWGNSGASFAGHPDMYLLVDGAAQPAAAPEPSTAAIWSLLGISLVGLRWLRRRRRA